jgi:hypothetical protein
MSGVLGTRRAMGVVPVDELADRSVEVLSDPGVDGAQHPNEVWRVGDLEVEALDRDFWSAPSRCTVMKNLLSAVPGHRSAR